MPEQTPRYPRKGDTQTVYLDSVITDPNIEVGAYTIYNDFVNDPCEFQKNNVLYHYPINRDKLIKGRCAVYHRRRRSGKAHQKTVRREDPRGA